ncbi:hypothetical protein [Methylobacter sp.]|uniref:hypothetical protein n=1 Tax=Methylobacter sp. TaxID=2051955 RepID=UPI002488862D|nr:hypothetical protein [Methylobacter sp.]MDI1279460.1 hypothetical protein [Methylobacter sp.]MDI1360217.1 hypothetical protein [Methylobacter sp.]
MKTAVSEKQYQIKNPVKANVETFNSLAQSSTYLQISFSVLVGILATASSLDGSTIP